MPDFSIKPKANSVISEVKSQSNTRASAALSNLLGENRRIGEVDVFEILNVVENCETETTYGYSQQKGIGRKPVLVATGEELKSFSLNIKLHFDYCNPDDILTRLKEKAKAEESFSYFQGDKYIGEFVINKIHENVLSKYEDVILYAEITVDILEYCDPDEDEYEQQDKTKKETPADVQTVTKDKYKKPVDYVKNNKEDIFSTLSDKVINKALRNAESYINSSIGGISGGIF